MRREKRSSRRKPGASSSSGPPSTSTPGAPSSSGLIEDGEGLTFQHLGRAEAEFLYQEIFVRRAYFQSGVSLPATGQPTVVDVGANIGLFSLACHRANPHCRLVAVEPPASLTSVGIQSTAWKRPPCDEPPRARLSGAHHTNAAERTPPSKTQCFHPEYG